MSIIIYNNEYQLKKEEFDPENFINLRLKEKTIEDLIIIVPTGKWQRYLTNYYTRKYFEKFHLPAPELQIFNIQKFADFLFRKLFDKLNYHFISDSYRLSLFEEACQKTDLHFFKSNNDSKLNLNLIKRLSDTIFGIKEDGLSPADLQKDIVNDNPEVKDLNRLRDIIEIYKKYEVLLDKKYLDSTDIINKVSAELSILNSTNPSLLREKCFDKTKKTILVFGFSEFKLPEIRLFSQFGFSDIPFVINLNFSLKNGPLFSNLAETRDLLLKTQKFRITDTEEFESDDLFSIEDVSQMKPDEFFRKYLFMSNKKVVNQNFNDKISIFQFDTINSEVKYISKLVKNLIIKEKYKPTEIAIVSRNPSLYSSLFRDSFFFEKIPANISDRFELGSSPIISAIFSILDHVRNDYHRNSYIKIFQNPFVVFDDDVNLKNLINIFSGFRELRKPWEPKFAKRINQFIEKLKTEIDDDLDKFQYYLLKQNLENLQRGLNDLKKIEAKLPEIDDKILPNQLSDYIKNVIIKNLKMYDKIKEFYFEVLQQKNDIDLIEFDKEIEEVEKLSRSLTQFIKVIDELVFVLNDRFPNKEFDTDELIERLKIAVSVERYQIKEKSNYGVEITSIEQIRGIPFKVVILCGALEGIFPISYQTDSFIGKNLSVSKRRHYSSEQVQFYQFLINGSEYFDTDEKRIYITHHSFEGDNELVPSHFIANLNKVTGILESNYHQINEQNKNSTEFNWLKFKSTKIEIDEYNFKNHISDESENQKKNYYSYINECLKVDFDKIELNHSQIFKDEIENSLKNAISVSDIERYADCQYKHFVNKYLKLKESELVSKDFTPIETGDIIHDVLYHFYTTIGKEHSRAFITNTKSKEIDIKPVELKREKREDYYELLMNLAHEKFKSIGLNQQLMELTYLEIMGIEYENELNLKDDLSGNKGKLALWLKQELHRQENGWGFLPGLFELPFGLDKNKKNAIDAVEIGRNFKLKGKIDRVEFFEKDDKLFFIIADYKSTISNNHSDNEVYKGHSFQMPLYIEAFDNIMKEHIDNIEYAGACYYPVKKIKYNKNIPEYERLILLKEEFYEQFNLKIPKNKRQPEDLINKSIDLADDLIEFIKEGIFNVNPKSITSCTYCNYDTICKINKKFR